jgi:DNA-binding LacI/PurR family transcriptional regulator
MAIGPQLALALARLRAWIVAQGQAPGLRLPAIRSLARELAIDRNSLHRAMRQLIAHGELVQRGRVISLSMDIAPKAGSAVALRQVVLLAPPGVHAVGFGNDALYPHLMVTRIRQRCQEAGLVPVQIEIDGGGGAPPLPVGTVAVISLFDSLTHRHQVQASQHAVQRGLPLIVLDDSLPGGVTPYDRLPCDRVMSDQADGRRQLYRWLHARGRARIVPLAGMPLRPKAPRWLHAQHDGMRSACTNLGIPWHAPIVLPQVQDALWYGTEDLHARVIAGALLGRLGDTPELCAVIAPTDALIPPLARALRLLGRDLPQRILVAGYDGYYWTDQKMRDWRERCRFDPVVSMLLPGVQLGDALMDLVQERIAGGVRSSPRTVMVPMTMIHPPEPSCRRSAL